jgi:polysaccharide transporter, PST family
MEDHMSDSKLLRGTFILTAGTFLSKFLGMIYIIPFFLIVGEQGGALFQYGYTPYAIFISMATMGVPLAVSKFVSKYNALGDYETGRQLFRTGLVVMFATGFIAFLLLFLTAPLLAPYIISENNAGNTIEDITAVIRMVSVALIIVPAMSIIRGFFQGHQSMGPTAVSQVVEQIVRIAFLLVSSYIVLNVLNGKLATAVGFATFGAFVGALGGMVVLGLYWRKRKNHLNELLQSSTTKTNMTKKEMMKELFSYAGPFVFVGLAIPLYQVVEQFTFNRALGTENAESVFAYVHYYGHKLVMIPVSLATGFALSLIPAVTKSFTAGNHVHLKNQINQTIQAVFLLILPAVIGLSVLAYPAFTVFFTVSEIGASLLRWYAPVALLFSLFTVTAAILQGINQQRYAVISLFLGFLFKVTMNSLFIQSFGAVGSIVTTAIGFTISVLFNLIMIGKHTDVDYNKILRRTMLIVIFTFLMAITVSGIQWGLSNWITFEDGRGASSVILFISIPFGAGIYFFLSWRSSLLSHILGHRISFLKKRNRNTIKS